MQELEALLGASPATVRRDLCHLEKLGMLVRTHGGVLHPDHLDGELSFDKKSRAALDTKLALAEAACSFVRAGDKVFVDAGTTTFELGKRLLAMEKLTVFTNSIPLLNERTANGTRLVALGGEVRSLSLALVGSQALHWVRQISVDIAFLGTSGIDPTEGPTTTELSEAGVKSAFVAKASRVVVLADAAKWGRPEAIRYASWSQIHDLFTDQVLSRSERARLTERGTKVHQISSKRIQ